jgi:hypothetical protein
MNALALFIKQDFIEIFGASSPLVVDSGKNRIKAL